MISARIAGLLERRRETTALRRFAGSRRVLSSYGSLAGAAGTIARRTAELEDEAVQKKWEAGQITDEEYLVHQRKRLLRPWITPEEKRLGEIEINQLREKVDDNRVYKELAAGVRTRESVLTYELGKLAKMLPGSQAYDLQMAKIAGLQRQVNLEKRKRFRLTQEASIRSAPGRNTPEEYEKRAELYQQLADQARVDNQPEEAAEYEAQAYDFRDYAQTLKTQLAEKEAQEKEREAEEKRKTTRGGLIKEINLLVNDYRDNKISPRDFISKMNAIEEKVLNAGETDLLEKTNDWVNYAREDIRFGKPYQRGGERRGQAGAGTAESVALKMGKVEDLEFEKAKIALIESVTDKQALATAMAELTDRYLNGFPPTPDDPDGWVGLKKRQELILERAKRGKGDIRELSAIQKKTAENEKNLGLLGEAVDNPEKFGLLYKADGGVEIVDKSQPVIDPETGDMTYYLEGRNIAPVEPGVFIEGKPLVVTSKEGEPIVKGYWGRAGKKEYQWIEGEKPVPVEEFQKQAREAADVRPGFIKGVEGFFKGLFQPRPQKQGALYLQPALGLASLMPSFGKGRLGAWRIGPTGELEERKLLAEAGMPDIRSIEGKPITYERIKQEGWLRQLTTPATEKAKEITERLPSLATQILPGAPVAKAVLPVIKPAIQKVQEVVKPAVEKMVATPLSGAPAFKPEEQVKITEPIRIAQPPVEPLVVTPTTTYKEAEAARKEAEKLKLAVPPKTALQQQAEKGFKIQLGPEFAPPSPPKPQEPWWEKAKKTIATQIWPTITGWFRR